MLVAPVALAAPKADLWPHWDTHDPDSELSVDHQPWNDLLADYINEHNGINLVAYNKVGANDRVALEDYIGILASLQVGKLNRDEQLAYWINLYNALTVQLILDNYPLTSIRDISGSLFAAGPWDDQIIEVENLPMTLNDIEHRVLRPIWQDARIHYAVNCASMSCPNLATIAFTVDNTEELLDANARAYANHPRGASITDGQLTVSSIYKWYAVDFGDSDTGIINHLKRYANDDLRAKLAGIDSIADDSYDWSLNLAK